MNRYFNLGGIRNELGEMLMSKIGFIKIIKDNDWNNGGREYEKHKIKLQMIE